MSLLKSYSNQLFLGSERKIPTVPEHSGKLGQICQQIANADDKVEAQILRTAASLHLYNQGGFIPAAATEKPFEKSPVEEQEVLQDENVKQATQQVLCEGLAGLLHLSLVTLIQKKLLMPPALLPALFDAAIQSPEIKPYLNKVIGRRGQWLLKANQQWQSKLFVEQQPTEDSWQHGSFQQAMDYIKELRKADAGRARELISARLPELDAKQRAELLDVMSINLSIADESLLESLIKDRSKDVRKIAASFLALIPDSQFSQRAVSRIKPCVRDKRGNIMELEVPYQFDSTWKADGIEEKAPSSIKLGPKAWWLYQLVLNLPLNWWERRLKATPAECLRWGIKSQWPAVILNAWQQVCINEKNADWAKAFLKAGSLEHLNTDVENLILCVDIESKLEYWLMQSQDGVSNEMNPIILSVTQHLVQDYQQKQSLTNLSLDNEMLKKFIQNFNAYLFSSSNWDYYFRARYLNFLCLIPDEVFSDALVSWPTDVKANSTTEEFIAKAHQVKQIRTIFYQLAMSK